MKAGDYLDIMVKSGRAMAALGWPIREFAPMAENIDAMESLEPGSVQETLDECLPSDVDRLIQVSDHYREYCWARDMFDSLSLQRKH